MEHMDGREHSVQAPAIEHHLLNRSLEREKRLLFPGDFFPQIVRNARDLIAVEASHHDRMVQKLLDSAEERSLLEVFAEKLDPRAQLGTIGQE